MLNLTKFSCLNIQNRQKGVIAVNYALSFSSKFILNAQKVNNLGMFYKFLKNNILTLDKFICIILGKDSQINYNFGYLRGC
jgi:hypothetical protein